MGLIPTAAVLTVSDRSFRGERPDGAGPLLKNLLQSRDWDVLHLRVVPDDVAGIQDVLRGWCGENIDLIVTTGGTGLGPRDVTPEATAPLLDKELPGLVEWMRGAGQRKNPFAILSRAVAGTRRQSLIINLPGNPSGALESLELLLPVLPHACHTLRGGDHSLERPAHDRADPVHP